MSLHSVQKTVFDFFSHADIQVEAVDENLTSDAGLLIFRQFDQQHQLTQGFAQRLTDQRRTPEHTLLEMVRSRVFGIIAGYEDQNDHGKLRSDPVFKLIADRTIQDDDLASQPTLSRFENSIPPAALLALEEWFIQQFVDSFEEPPREVTLDADVFDDPTHGDQQLTFFHGYYGQYQYLVRAITCAENDQVVLPALLFGTADVALGLQRDLERIAAALRKRFPDVLIRLRADSGYSKPWLHEWCDHHGVEFTIGVGMNPVLKRNSDELLKTALKQQEETGQPQRLFTQFEYQAGSWEQPRLVIVKCEANSQGTNRRAVVSNRPGARILPEATYGEYVQRGEAENRNKELKNQLHGDRLSDHRFMANCFRMFLHCLANNLLVALRQTIASPPPFEDSVADDGEVIPAEATTGKTRRANFNLRRRVDPLGEGHADTWRLRLIKVAARICVTARRVRVFLSSSWPFLDHFWEVSSALQPPT
jgi:hypothetical protein